MRFDKTGGIVFKEYILIWYILWKYKDAVEIIPNSYLPSVHLPFMLTNGESLSFILYYILQYSM